MKELTRREHEQLERKEAIISKAEELFCKYGFEKVSMDTLAKECEFTKRTIYRYFTCKEDLFFAVALRGYNRLFDMMKNDIQKGTTGFEKIRLSYYTYYDYFCKFPELIQLINMSGIIKSRSVGMNVPYRNKFTDLDKCLFEELIKTFHEGKTDGSIRSDLEISELAFSSVFVVTGFFQLLSLSGNTYTNHFGLDKKQFAKFTIEMLVDFLKNK
ncbi:TetR/AcrR family transcriptional regulator [Clostridium sp. AWRP]|uniref:TetR/AcrR family transcriptional regulator n=1 Tax=Clostridium sp. AWRP TaxID=2212991 RepID=UPI000FDB0443|nr:TetR/AcrR family transcriptional regulator [Clostridium sp. AWRP]AZV57872.1 TetR family transcriptional regulator [Clostridium sp. AWRP]